MSQSPHGSPQRRALVARTTNLSPDPRVRKVVKTLQEDGWTVDVACWSRGSGRRSITEPLAATVHVFHRPAPYGSGLTNLRAHLQWQRWLRRASRSHDYTLFYACDLDTAWTLAREGRRRGIPLVFDQFDQFADRITAQPFHGVLSRLEARTISAADSVVVASPERARNLSRQSFVVENVSDHSPVQPDGSPETAVAHLTALYAGVLHLDRGLGQAVEVATLHPEWTLQIGGFGPLDEWAARVAAAHSNIEFLGVLTPQQLLDHAARSSVLLALYDPRLRNNVTTASGKFWDALAAGTPIVAARGTAVGERVGRHRLGWTIDYGDARQLAAALHERSTWGQQDIDDFRRRADELLKDHSWPVQRTRLLAAVDVATSAAHV